MAEAEDVLVDAARHATVFAQRLWQRHSKTVRPEAVALAYVAERLDLLVTAVFGARIALKVAQSPPPVTLLTRIFRRETLPRAQEALPATDGVSVWLPSRSSVAQGLRDYRCMALLQAMRIVRGSAACVASAAQRGVGNLYLLLEACSAESMLAALLPGMRAELTSFRLDALAKRPPPEAFVPSRREFEHFARTVMQSPERWSTRSPTDTLARASNLTRELGSARSQLCSLFLDRWTGELKAPLYRSELDARAELAPPAHEDRPARSAHLARRPEVRNEGEDEDDAEPGPWMVQTAQPHEHAEDPMGMQRPADRDDQTPAEDLGESLAELPEARLVRSPEPAKEILVSDDVPSPLQKWSAKRHDSAHETLCYPEWDYRARAYRTPGAAVHLLDAQEGSSAWVERTLSEHRALCDSVRRYFEQLRASRMRLRRQLDGDDVDLQAYVEARSDFRAGRSMSQALYETTRALQRDLAVSLLVDVSGSTDAWVSAHRRIVDVEREALLFVCIALDGLREPYNVLAFSGVGPNGVTVRAVKRFEETYGLTVARRIAALEPERYTRVGAAIRHASTLLMRQSARHRLLLVLSDGKPNDEDQYDGRYGVEDARQAVLEARMQGVDSFCLTVDRHAAAYLPYVFGARQYALLARPELLPRVLLEWLRRLLAQ